MKPQSAQSAGKKISWFIYCYSFGQEKEATVEAEFDTIFHFQFESLKETNQKKILIDQSHNTIYSLSYGKETAREMLRIMNKDGFLHLGHPQ